MEGNLAASAPVAANGAPDYDVIIVGGGLASARAVRSYREAGGDGSLALFSRDTILPYHRPPFSKRFLRGEQERDAALVEQPSFYEDQAVDVFLETGVSSVDTRERRLELEDGKRVRYTKLLLASGAWPRRPAVAGGDLPGIFTLRTADDSAAIREAAGSGREAVVLGAGFIGMEVAASLRHLGVEVTLIHRGSGLFELFGAPELERELMALYERNGVTLMLPDEVAAFGGRSAVDTVETSTRKRVPTDFVVAGLGVEPVTDFLAGSGLELDNGIVVDEHYATNVAGVYAAGDVARFWDPIFGRRRRIEHWSNANYQGTEVGKVLAGEAARYDAVSSFFTEVFGVTIRVFGDWGPGDDLVLRGSIDDGLLGLYLSENRVGGAISVGQDEETENRVKDAIRVHAEVPAGADAFEHALAADVAS